MSSTRPITFANRVRTAALLALAVGAVAVIAVSGWDAMGAMARASGLDSATRAAAMPRGPERDRALDAAQGVLADALTSYPNDAALWGALSQIRFLQATGAEVQTVSPALIGAARDAAQRAIDLAPADSVAPARLAQALAFTSDRRGEGVAALALSYRLRPLDGALAPARADAAARLWDLADADVRRAARAEACLARRDGATVSSVYADVSRDPTCAAPRRDSSPTGQ